MGGSFPDLLRFGKRFEQAGRFTGWSAFEAGIPVCDGGGEPAAQLGKLSNLAVECGDLAGRHGCDSAARCSAGVALTKNAGKFREAESCFESAADGLNAEERVGRIEAVVRFCAQRPGEETELFVVADGICTDAGSGGELAGGEYAIAHGVHGELSMNLCMGSRVKGEIDGGTVRLWFSYDWAWIAFMTGRG